MMVMSPSPMNAPSIVSPSSMVRQITSATGQEEQVDFMVSLGCENGGLEHLHFPPKAHLHSGLTTPRKHPSTHSENGRALKPRSSAGIRASLATLLAARRRLDGYRTVQRNALTALVRTTDLGVDARRALTDRQITLIASWRTRPSLTSPTG